MTDDLSNSPSFIRMEAKVDAMSVKFDALNTGVNEYKVTAEKNFVTRAEFEVFKASVTPNNRLISKLVEYTIVGLIGALIAILVNHLN